MKAREAGNVIPERWAPFLQAAAEHDRATPSADAPDVVYRDEAAELASKARLAQFLAIMQPQCDKEREVSALLQEFTRQEFAKLSEQTQWAILGTADAYGEWADTLELPEELSRRIGVLQQEHLDLLREALVKAAEFLEAK